MTTTQLAAKRPFHGGPCYACDSAATGLRDRRPEGGELERACDRHKDTTIRTYDACLYCNGSVRKGSADIEGFFAHVKCVKEQSL